MQEIIKTVPVTVKVETVELANVEYAKNNRIYLCEKGKAQSVLTFKNGMFFWRSFYLDQTDRTVYSSFTEAIESRFEKKQKVFVLQNKSELKEMIKVSKNHY